MPPPKKTKRKKKNKKKRKKKSSKKSKKKKQKRSKKKKKSKKKSKKQTKAKTKTKTKTKIKKEPEVQVVEHESDSQLEFGVDRIVAKAVRNNVTMYKVLWKGFELPETTWEPVENLSNAQDALDNFHARELEDQQKASDDMMTDEIASDAMEIDNVTETLATGDVAKKEPKISDPIASETDHAVSEKEPDVTSKKKHVVSENLMCETLAAGKQVMSEKQVEIVDLT